MSEFRMPSLGADMDAGTLVEWLVKPGERVERGQVVAVIETQKGAVEVEIWEAGTVDRILVEPQTKVPVGTVLATLRAAGEPAAPAAPRAAPAAAPRLAAAEPVARATRPRIAPAARKRAEELGLDVNTVEPAEPGGVVSRADVERAARAGAAVAPARAEPDWRVPMRRAIAAAMSRSKREIPHYYLATDIDVTGVLARLAEENRARAVAERVLPVVPLLKAVALALREVPELNGFWTDGAFRASSAVHLGVAVAMRGGGLVAPAIHDADTKGIDQLMAELRDLITRVRGGRLRGSEMSDPTVTVTSLGEQGVESVFGVIYPPQVALVGLGKVTDRAWVANGTVTARKVITATLSADHRASDGHRGALFLAALARLLQSPGQLA
jgi:pyruvate dehydrogenase E2 component (dihydrolipoamide acetyltransferase)